MNSPLPQLPTSSEIPAQAPAEPAPGAGEMPRPRHAEADPLVIAMPDPVAPPDPKNGDGAGPPRSRPVAAGLPLSPAPEPAPKMAPRVGAEPNPPPKGAPRVIPAPAPVLPQEEEKQFGGAGPQRVAEATGAGAVHASQQLSTAAATNLDAHLRALGEAVDFLQRSAHLHETLLQLYRAQTTRLDKLEKQLTSMSSSHR